MGGWSSESFVQQEHLKADVEMLLCSGYLIEFEGCTSLSVLRWHHWCLTAVWDASNEGRELKVFTLEKVLLYSYPCLLLSVAVADLGWADRCLSGPHESSLSNWLQSHDAEC